MHARAQALLAAQAARRKRDRKAGHDSGSKAATSKTFDFFDRGNRQSIARIRHRASAMLDRTASNDNKRRAVLLDDDLQDEEADPMVERGATHSSLDSAGPSRVDHERQRQVDGRAMNDAGNEVSETGYTNSKHSQSERQRESSVTPPPEDLTAESQASLLMISGVQEGDQLVSYTMADFEQMHRDLESQFISHISAPAVLNQEQAESESEDAVTFVIQVRSKAGTNKVKVQQSTTVAEIALKLKQTETVRFRFDGEILANNATMEDLGIEEMDIVEII
eukprot:jgi/Hompol1/2742/HPOL_000631-RA